MRTSQEREIDVLSFMMFSPTINNPSHVVLGHIVIVQIQIVSTFVYSGKFRGGWAAVTHIPPLLFATMIFLLVRPEVNNTTFSEKVQNTNNHPSITSIPINRKERPSKCRK